MRGFPRLPPSCVHRFLILGGQFGNRCMDCLETASLLQRFLISGPDLRITAAPSSQQCGMARLQLSLRLRWFASDSNFRCCKGEWSRLRQSLRQRVPAFNSNIERRPDSKKDSRSIPRCPYFIRCHRSTRLKCFDCFQV